MKEAQISELLLDRPEAANAFDLESALRLKKTIENARRAKHQGLVISSASSKVFCAGGDLKAYRSLIDKKTGMAINKKIRDVLTLLKKSPLVSVAAVEGDALGGGVELALACDFIVCSTEARFSLAQVRQGLTPGWGGLKNLLNRVSHPVALRWLCSGTWISAREALRLGLIDEVVPPFNAASRSRELISAVQGDLFPILKKMISEGARGEERIFNALWWSKPHLRALGKN